jgi:hypothetical protein
MVPGLKPAIHAPNSRPSRKQNRRDARTPRGPGSVGAAIVVALAMLFTPSIVLGQANVAARAAKSISVSDTGHLHRIRNAGEAITEEGQTKGTIPGRVLARLVVGPEVEVTFTIFTHAGTISGKGSGVPKGRSEEPSFNGSMTLTSGTGLYRRIHGHGRFYGTLNRSTYKMVVQTAGTVSY